MAFVGIGAAVVVGLDGGVSILTEAAGRRLSIVVEIASSPNRG